MSVLIDLDHYADEVSAFAALASDFVGATSTLRLEEVARQLRQSVDTGSHHFVWETRDPVIFRPSHLYDGPGREHSAASLSLGFKCEFRRRTSTSRKCRVWQVERSATHLAIAKEVGRMRFHIDYKNADQWGPQIHFQVDELDALGNLPIPRIPSISFLPTDCADLGLSELHPEEWRRVQSSGNMSRHMSVVRSAQEARTLAYVGDIRRQWDGDRRTTRVCMLQDYTAGALGLPDRHGKEAVF